MLAALAARAYSIPVTLSSLEELLHSFKISSFKGTRSLSSCSSKIKVIPMEKTGYFNSLPALLA
jgi:hypothetical protein